MFDTGRTIFRCPTCLAVPSASFSKDLQGKAWNCLNMVKSTAVIATVTVIVTVTEAAAAQANKL